jgi:hypothetical protein
MLHVNTLRQAIQLALLFILIQHANGGRDSFEYNKFTNNAGKVLEARIFRDHGEEIELQKKKGGKIYKLKKSSLDEKSRKIINDAKSNASLEAANNPTVTNLYKCFALGLNEEVKFVFGGKLAFRVKGWRINNQEQCVTMELEDDIYLELQLHNQDRWFFRGDSLYFKTGKQYESLTDYWWYPAGIHYDKEHFVARKGGSFTLNISKNITKEWARVGVSEGLLIRVNN